MADEDVPDEADAAGAEDAAEAAAVAGTAAAAFGFAPADLSTPPCPLHAPFPAWLVVPSLQVTSAPSAGAAAALDPDEAALFDAGTLPADALLSTPPCPLHAPFPTWLVVPSLQVTSAPSAGAAAAVAPDEAVLLLLAVELDSLFVAGALAAEALLSTPPWPLQAPFPA